jgi:uncharacterized membrane protein YkoI
MKKALLPLKIMFVKKVPELLLLLLLSAIPAVALARAASLPTTANSAQHLREPDMAILEEIKRFATVQISVRDAIQIAEGHAGGAKAVDVSFDSQGDRSTYRVKTYRHDQIWEGTVDAATGIVVGAEIVTSVTTLDARDRSELAGFRAAGIDLSDVVPIAEKYGAGKAVSAGLADENGRLIFLVVVLADGSLKQISVDPSQNRRRPTN